MLNRVWCSAKTGAGIDLVLQTIAQQLEIEWLDLNLVISPPNLDIRSELYNLHVITDESVVDDGSIEVNIKIDAADWRRLNRQTDKRLEKCCTGDIPSFSIVEDFELE